jgi:putative intracellular protease/amidase
MARHVLFALTSHDRLGDTGRRTGAYAPEFAHPAQVFECAGYRVSYVSVAGGSVPLDGLKDDDQITQSYLSRPEVRHALEHTPTAEQLYAGDYDVIYFAGGHGTMWDFADCAPLAQLAADIYDDGGVVAGVCHGPAGLLNIRLRDGSYLVDGKEVSSFTNEEETVVGLASTVPFLLEDALTEHGAKHTKANNFAAYAVSDKRLVTGQNPASAVKVAELVIQAQRGDVSRKTGR